MTFVTGFFPGEKEVLISPFIMLLN